MGREILLVGFDDIEECDETWPRLSSIDCNIEGFGLWAASALVEWLESATPPPTLYRARVELKDKPQALVHERSGADGWSTAGRCGAIIPTAGPVDSNVSCADVVRLNHCPEGRRMRYDDSYHTNGS